MTKHKILVTDYVHPILISGLEDRGFHVDYIKKMNPDDLPAIIDQYFGIVINSKMRMFPALLEKAPNLKFIARLGSGLEIIDQDYCRNNGIQVIRTPAGNCNAVAEHGMGMLLSLANNLCSANSEVKSLHWDREKNRGWELFGKTVGIVGFGHTGNHLAMKLSSFGVRVLAHDKYLSNFGPAFSFVENVSKEQLQKEADIISFHLPLTKECYHYCDLDFLNKCRDGVVILNTSRGQVIDTKALLNGLSSGKVQAAALDVFENEKPHSYSAEEAEMYQELFSYQQVLVSPHVAGWTHESLLKIAEIVLEEVDMRVLQKDA